MNAQLNHKSFIVHFQGAMQRKEYICFEYAYYYKSKKGKAALKVNKILSEAGASANYYASYSCTEPLTERISLLENLHDSLKTCAGRIENSIKKRWWFCILHLFGYQAKCPEPMNKLINNLSNQIEQLKDQENLSRMHLEKIEKEKAEQEKAEREKPESTAFNTLLDPLKREIFDFLPIEDVLKNVALIKKAYKPSVDQHLHHFKTICNQIMQMKEAIPIYKREKFLFYFYGVMKEPTIRDFFQKEENVEFRNWFFNWVITNRKIIDKWDEVENVNILTDLIFEHGTTDQLTYYILIVCDGYTKTAKNPKAAKYFIESLIGEKRKKVFETSKTVYQIIVAMCDKRCLDPKSELARSLFPLFYNKNPKLVIWRDIRTRYDTDKDENHFQSLLSLFYVVKNLHLLEKLDINRRDQFQDYKDIVPALAPHDAHQQVYYRDIFPILFQYFNTSAKFRLLSHVILFAQAPVYHQSYEIDYLNEVLKTGNPEFLDITLKEAFERIRLDFKWGINNKIVDYLSTNEQIAAFTQACLAASQTVQEPFKHYYLRTTAVILSQKENMKVTAMKVFQDSGLDLNQYAKPFSFELHEVHYHEWIFNGLRDLNSEEKLEVLMKKITSYVFTKARILLRILAGGYQLPTGEVMLSDLNRTNHELIQKAFDDLGLKYEAYNQPIPIDIFVQAMK